MDDYTIPDILDIGGKLLFVLAVSALIAGLVL